MEEREEWEVMMQHEIDCLTKLSFPFNLSIAYEKSIADYRVTEICQSHCIVVRFYNGSHTTAVCHMLSFVLCAL